MFSEDVILKCDRLLLNSIFLNSGIYKKALDFFYKWAYAGIRNNHGKFLGEEGKLQTGKWWNELF